ncbi:MAG TPA: hypothetical protein VIH28_05635, partial [Ignavibacteriaceae bacterium]
NYRAVIIIIFAYILKTIDENPSELSIEVTPFNIEHKGKGRALPASGDDIFEVWVYEDEVTGVAKDDSVLFEYNYFGLKPENNEIYMILAY